MDLEEGQSTAVRRPGQVRREGATAARLRPPRSRGPMVVEFIGIPGSGKTTLCTAIVSSLRRDGFRVITEHDYFRWMKQPLHRRSAQ